MGKFILERHQFAPELNTVHVKSASGWHPVPAPGVLTLRDYRLANAPLRKGRHVKVSTVYPLCHVLAGKQLKSSGYAETYKSIKIVRDYHASRLADTGRVVIESRWVG